MTPIGSKVFNRKDRACVDTLRLLAVDMVEKAKSGHPGFPLGAAPMAYVLWARFLRHDPSRPDWPDRDRFVLSAGHGSALLYAFLHLAGYGLTMDDLKNFRQWGSPTPGHPERGLTPGVEATTGPLGHGMAMGVGLALAERHMAARFNRPGFAIFDHHTYALVSDGDLMEGVASEAASLAGNQGLGKLIYLYDSNDMTIEGHASLTFSEDVRVRFTAYNWHVSLVSDGEDLQSVKVALDAAKQETDRPTLIICRTKLGAGSPKEDTPGAHGEPLGAEGLSATRAHYGYGDKGPFFVDERVAKHFREQAQARAAARARWEETLAAYGREHPVLAAELKRRLGALLPDGLDQALAASARAAFPKGASVATRVASGKAINILAKSLPELIGGSADLAPSNKTLIEGEDFVGALRPDARNFHFGVREQGMGAILNGLALHGGLIPYGGTFLVFSDFLRPAVRLSALMAQKVVYVLTHDSVGVGEDGPTHQPVEHLAALRAIPDLVVMRPADAHETVAAWGLAVAGPGPTALILSRQNLPTLHPDEYPMVTEGVAKGAYVLSPSEGPEPGAIIVATGSEVHLALAAQGLLRGKRDVRVVSMPSWELFERQPAGYKETVFPAAVTRRLALEAGRAMGWERYAGPGGKILSIETFGRSAPAGVIFGNLGFTAENVARLADSLFG
ncbi:MAG: transketolase [Deltaproteobacteria bacterium]|jgi:transketolase|nr:transketolase [Deltaproteobacteria bacterium]